MESKYTKGPWKVEQNKILKRELVINSDQNFVAHIHLDDFDTDEEGHANAKLIAAAPAMLKALQTIQAAAQLACIASVNSTNFHPDLILENINPAIKSATEN